MFDRLSRLSATVFAGSALTVLAGIPVALAQSYPPPPGYSQPLQPAPYDAQADRAPDFDRLDGDGRGTGLPPPGYQQQPNYQQAAPQQQSYQQQPGLDPRGPVLPPDDPRYGRRAPTTATVRVRRAVSMAVRPAWRSRSSRIRRWAPMAAR